MGDDEGSQDCHQEEEANDTQSEGDFGIGSKPTCCRTPTALPLRHLLDAVSYSGVTCEYDVLWGYQLRLHQCGSHSCLPFIHLHMLPPFHSPTKLLTHIPH